MSQENVELVRTGRPLDTQIARAYRLRAGIAVAFRQYTDTGRLAAVTGSSKP
jgi:ketosteroid isomerase-like protein